jgi:hypothetical protein
MADRLVSVKWDDATGFSRWHPREQVEALTPFSCESVGWIIKETKETLTLAATRDLSEGQLNDVNLIPKSMVRGVVDLQAAPKSKKGRR